MPCFTAKAYLQISGLKFLFGASLPYGKGVWPAMVDLSEFGSPAPCFLGSIKSLFPTLET